MDQQVIEGVKQAMGYMDGNECCENCDFHEGPDMSGFHDAKPERCIKNAFWIPVKPSGHCNSFLAK